MSTVTIILATPVLTLFSYVTLKSVPFKSVEAKTKFPPAVFTVKSNAGLISEPVYFWAGLVYPGANPIPVISSVFNVFKV